MYTRFYEYNGITFGYTTPVSVGGIASCSIIEIPSKPNADWPNLPKYNKGDLIKPHLKLVIPIVLKLLDLEIKRLKVMNRGQKIVFQWFYFDLNKQGHPIID